MIQKAIGLATGSAILSIYLWSQLQPSDALFSFASANLAVNIIMVGLAALLIWVSFRNKFKTLWGYILALVGVAMSILIVLGGMVFSGLDYRIYDFFGPLNFLLIAETGVILSLAVLTYEHQPYELSLPRVRLPRAVVTRPTISIPKVVFHTFKHVRFS